MFFSTWRQGGPEEEIARFPPGGVYSQHEQHLAVGQLLDPEHAGIFSMPRRFAGVGDCAGQFRRIHREFAEHGLYSRARTGALLTLLMTELAREALSPESVSSRPARANRTLAERVISYIDLHLTQPLTCTSVAATLNYHPNYLNAIIRAETGLSMHAYIRQVKLRYADFLLTETDMRVTEIAHMLAFCDNSHFARRLCRRIRCFPLRPPRRPDRPNRTRRSIRPELNVVFKSTQTGETVCAVLTRREIRVTITKNQKHMLAPSA